MTRQQAVNYFGTQSAIARLLGLARSTVCEWGENVPLPYQAQLQILSKNALTAELPVPLPPRRKSAGRPARRSS